MTRELVTQLANALERMDGWLKVRHPCGLMPDEIALVKAAREFLATEPSGERAELIADHQKLNMNNYAHDDVDKLNQWAIRAYEMLEATAQRNVTRIEDLVLHNAVLRTGTIIDKGQLVQQSTNPACPSCQSPGLMYECVHCSANN